VGIAGIIRRSMVVIFVAALAICAIGLFIIFRGNTYANIEDEARALLATALAVRAYTVEQVVPKLKQLPEDSFHPETVPSYAAQSVFARAGKQNGNYAYREAALNPTNPDDRASAFETELIQRFRGDPTLEEISGTRKSGDALLFYLARPITITDERCLMCHSTPERAPQAMLAQYGSSNGFGWEFGEIVAIQILTVPLSRELQDLFELLLVLLLMLSALFALVYLAVSVPLHQQVIRPLRRLADTAERASLRDTPTPLPRNGAQELRRLAKAIDRLRTSLARALSRGDPYGGADGDGRGGSRG